MPKTRYIFECKRCGEIYLEPHHINCDPSFNSCPFCGTSIYRIPPNRTLQRWVSEGYTGWWIFKKEIGHWENA